MHAPMDGVDIIVIALAGVLVTFVAAALIGLMADYLLERTDDR